MNRNTTRKNQETSTPSSSADLILGS